jgi:hypothetical protein
MLALIHVARFGLALCNATGCKSNETLSIFEIQTIQALRTQHRQRALRMPRQWQPNVTMPKLSAPNMPITECSVAYLESCYAPCQTFLMINATHAYVISP